MNFVRRNPNVMSSDMLSEQKQIDGLARLIKQKYADLGPYT